MLAILGEAEDEGLSRSYAAHVTATGAWKILTTPLPDDALKSVPGTEA